MIAAASRTDRILIACLYVVLAVFAAVSVHNFFAYVGHYPYWSIDDGLSVVSTSWLQTGRYGDPSAPVEGFSDVQRYRGFFIYGPWPFAAGAAITWLFGFSVQALRALHLIAAWSLVLVAARLFTGLRGAIATTIVGLGVSYAVVQIEWPMFRPDIFVTLFAAALIWSAAVASRSGRQRDWFLCGLAAGCGALSHLIGASLVPASLIVLAAAVTIRRDAFVRPVVSLALGWLASAVMFYASFGFRVVDHITNLLQYRARVRAAAAATLSSSGPFAVWAEHYRIATSGVPRFFVAAVVVSLIVAIVLIAASVRRRTPAALDVVALLLPGCAIFVLYAVTLGFYSNFHTGYVILPQLVGLWIVASTMYVVLADVESRAAVGGRLLAVIVAIAIVVAGARSAYALARADDDPRLALARSWISIPAYLDAVLGPIPQRAVAWGAEPFATEGPQRIQLISTETALWLMAAIPADRRQALAPDYLVWGHPESAAAVINPFAEPQRDPLELLPRVLPGTEFSLASIVSAAPYGATRVYQRRLPEMPAPQLPAISVWDAAQQRWLHDAAPVDAVAWQPAAGSLSIAKGPRRWHRTAASAVAADLAPGWYLFRIDVEGDARPRLLITAAEGSAHEYIAGDLPPDVDVAARFASEPIYLLRHHGGGRVGLNLFADQGGARIGRVDTLRISGLTDYQLARERMAEQPLPPLMAWVPDTSGGVTAVAAGSRVEVSGNASAWGYQLVSPRIDVTPGVDVTVRLPVASQAGRVCTGVLDERQQQWLVRPLDQAPIHRFHAGPNHAMFIVVSNCNAGGASVASRFTVDQGRYAVFADAWYVDTLMREFANRSR